MRDRLARPWLRLRRALLALLIAPACNRAEIDLTPPEDPVLVSGRKPSTANQSRLGVACDDNEDCGDSRLRCIPPGQDIVAGRGAPAGGFCTLECDGDAECRAVEDGAWCVTLLETPLVSGRSLRASLRHCVQGCAAGAAPTSKCQGRADLACRPFEAVPSQACGADEEPSDVPDRPAPSAACSEGTFCLHAACRALGCGPRCNTDDHCAPSRACNPKTGLCDAGPRLRVPVGAACEGTGPTCADGVCLVIAGEGGGPIGRMCTQTCSLGATCADGLGACVLPRFQSFEAGDIGYCAQACDCETPCVNARQRCFTREMGESAAPHQGVCLYAELGGRELACAAGMGGAHSE